MKKLLIDLPEPYFRSEQLKERFAKIEERYEVRKTSHETPEAMAEDLAWAEAIMMGYGPVLSEKDFAQNITFY